MLRLLCVRHRNIGIALVFALIAANAAPASAQTPTPTPTATPGGGVPIYYLSFGDVEIDGTERPDSDSSGRARGLRVALNIGF